MDPDSPPGDGSKEQSAVLPQKDGKPDPGKLSSDGDQRDGGPTNTGDTGMDTSTSASTTGTISGKSPSSGDPAGGKEKSAAKKLYQERKAAEHKKRNEEVRLALWPTPEAAKTIRDKALVDEIDYRRLDASVNFRDAWKTFSRASNPTTKDRDKLRKLATDILAKKKGGNHKNSGEKRPGDKGKSVASKSKETTKESDKRKRDSSTSSSSSSTGGLKPAFKIPKVKSTGDAVVEPVTAQPEVAAVTAEGTMETETDHESGVVESEAELGSLDNFTMDVAGALPDSGYAAAVKGKKMKESFPYILYVNKGKELREKFPREVWKLFLQKFNELLVDNTLNDVPTPDIAWTGYSKGTGVIATTDDESQTLAIDIIDTIEVAEYEFKGRPKGYADNSQVVTIKAPTEFKNVPTGKLAQAIFKKNELDGGAWRVLSSVDINGNSGERIIKFVVYPSTMNLIRKKKGWLKIGSTKLEVFHQNKRVS